MTIVFHKLVILQETDGAILSIIGYPAFAVSQPQLVNTTLITIQVFLLANLLY